MSRLRSIMMPDIEPSSPTFNLHLSSFQEDLVDAFGSHEPNPTRAVERTLKRLIHDRVHECAKRLPAFIAAEIKIHSVYNRQNKTLAALAREGLNIWYLEILTKWHKGIDFRAIRMDIIGLPVQPLTYGQGIRRTQNNYAKELKTQINFKTTILHIIITADLLRTVFEKVKDRQSFLIWDSSCLSLDQQHLLPTYIDNATDQVSVCDCSIQAFQKSGGLPSGCKILKGVCHLCQINSNGKDELVQLYGPEFLTNQDPFISQLQLSGGLDHRTAIEEAARRFQTSKWKTEALLYAIVRDLFPNNTIIREFSPTFLEGLRIDIFVKEVNLAIEYQGEQHFVPVKAFGGKESHENLIRRDRKKKLLCQENGLNVEYFSYKDSITHPTVQRRLRKYMEETRVITS